MMRCNYNAAFGNVSLPFAGDQWIKLNEFSECVGWNLIYGLNMLKRNGSKWDSRNAEELLDFTRNHRYHVNWELGNGKNCNPRFRSLLVLFTKI